MLLWLILSVFLSLVVSDPRVASSSTVVTADEQDSSNLFPMDLRSIDDYALMDIILISDIDGSLHCVDRNTGALVWSLPINEPLVKINTNTSSDQDETSNILWFVEPYSDGSLYYFTPEYGLNKLPTSIKQLVLESPFSLAGDDKIYTGTRRASLYTINVRTGEIVSHFGNGDQMTTTNSGASANQDYIMIGRTVYELSIHSKENSNVLWNVTFANWGPNNIDNDLILQNQQSLDKLYFTPFHDKSLLAINKDLGTPVWITKLPALAVSVFDIFHNTKSLDNYVLLPHPLKVLNDLQINQYEGGINSELCFINKTAHSNEWFAMSFNNYPTLIKSAPISKYQLALFKLESYAGNNMDDPFTTDTLRNLKLSDESIEGIINGVHRVTNLGTDSTYQPKSRFKDTMKIGGGNPESQQEVELIETNLPIPNIIEGIKFSSSKTKTQDRPTLLPASRTNKGELIRVGNDAEETEFSLNDEPIIISSKPHGTSFIKRVLEDLVVLVSIAVFVFSINNYQALVKRLEEVLGRPLPVISKELESREEDKHEVLVTKETEEEDVNTEETVIDDTKNPVDPIEKLHTKKVTIIEPNDAVETGFDDSASVEKIEVITEPENENDGDTEEVTTKKKRKRGSRGGKRSKRKNQEDKDTDKEYDANWNDSEEAENQPVISTTSLVKALNNINKIASKRLQIENNLVISERILGYGSHGTVVYEGTFENRPVAVKRMLLDFYDVANHEVKLLQESDDHPNVVRYFCSQSSLSEKFLYIALELCQCSLEDLIEKPRFRLKLVPSNGLDYSKLLFQLASGLNYLHNLKIVHRDLKPQNILIGDFKSMRTRFAANKTDELRLLISDFGLCKKLDHDQSSFRATTQNAASGTSGWRAPELLLSHDIAEISPDTVSSMSSTTNSINNNMTGTGQKRLTKAIDIFSLGCVFYYILTGGGHPFGDRYLREGNIIKGEYDLSALDKYKDKEEAKHLIALMIAHDSRARPNTEHIMKHPYFWSTSKKLDFLLKVSDRFEIERRDPPSDLLLILEASAEKVVHGNWHKEFKQDFMDNLGKYRKYQPERLMDLLRALRNKYHHFNDMPANLQEQMSPLPGGFYEYFNSKFPNLLMEVYFVVEKNLKEEHIFGEFF